MPDEPSSDRRVQRTRRQVVDAFVQLVRERPYDSIRVGDVVQDAAVGRSTFYAHYRGKDDLLVQSFAILYAALADAVALALRERDDRGHLTRLLEHIGQNRGLFRRMTTGGAAEAYTRSADTFARMISERLETWCDERRLAPRLPLAHVASALAHALLALIRAWLLERDAETIPAADLAAAVRDLARSHVAALLAARSV